MEKSLLRKIYKEKRKEIKLEKIESLSLSIANQTLNLPIWDNTNFHLFLPISTQKEVNTEYLLHILQGRDKSIIISKTNFETGKMKHFLLQENTVLKLSKVGIPEPVDGIEVAVKKLDVVFVPLLAYDIKGNRLGYGKGFYDRFLKECNANCRFVGLSFFEPETHLPTNKNDIALHYCVTPEKFYIF